MEQTRLVKANGAPVRTDMPVSEDRFVRLEREVSDMRVDNASLSTAVEHLAKAVDVLTVTVQGLRDAQNKARGALWLAVAAAGSIGALLMLGLKQMLGS